jgi:hypothetical protein
MCKERSLETHLNELLHTRRFVLVLVVVLVLEFRPSGAFE